MDKFLFGCVGPAIVVGIIVSGVGMLLLTPVMWLTEQGVAMTAGEWIGGIVFLVLVVLVAVGRIRL